LPLDGDSDGVWCWVLVDAQGVRFVVEMLAGGILGQVAYGLLIAVFGNDTIDEWVVGGEPGAYD